MHGSTSIIADILFLSTSILRAADPVLRVPSGQTHTKNLSTHLEKEVFREVFKKKVQKNNKKLPNFVSGQLESFMTHLFLGEKGGVPHFFAEFLRGGFWRGCEIFHTFFWLQQEPKVSRCCLCVRLAHYSKEHCLRGSSRGSSRESSRER